jgi:hypothetical protein
MSDEIDPFDKFIVNENSPIDKKLIAEIIDPFVESIGKNKIIDYKKTFGQSPTWVKTAVYLCCRKIMVNKEIITEEEAGPAEIAAGTGISADSAKNISRERNIIELVTKKGKKYFVPNHKLKKMKKMVDEYASGTSAKQDK